MDSSLPQQKGPEGLHVLRWNLRAQRQLRVHRVTHDPYRGHLLHQPVGVRPMAVLKHARREWRGNKAPNGQHQHGISAFWTGKACLVSNPLLLLCVWKLTCFPQSRAFLCCE